MNTRKDNKAKKTVRKVINRKIERNIFRNRIKSNRIKESWKNRQISRCKKFIDDLNKLIHEKKIQRTLEINRKLHLVKGQIQRLASGR